MYMYTHLGSFLVCGPACPVRIIICVEDTEPKGVQEVLWVQPAVARTQVDFVLPTLLLSQGPVLAREQHILSCVVELYQFASFVGFAYLRRGNQCCERKDTIHHLDA